MVSYNELKTEFFRNKDFLNVSDVNKIEGEYKFRITREGKDWFLAHGTDNLGNTFLTQGRTEEEVFMMMADAFMCSKDVRISLWNKILGRLYKY